MNCLCNWFEDSTIWLIIIALLILHFGCNGCNNGCGNTCTTGGCTSTCGGNFGCGCGCQ